MTTLEWLEQNKGKYKNREELIQDCMSACGVSRDNVLKKMRKKRVMPRHDTITISCDRIKEFRREHDKSYKIPKVVRECI